jgi:hypothetical protein
VAALVHGAVVLGDDPSGEKLFRTIVDAGPARGDSIDSYFSEEPERFLLLAQDRACSLLKTGEPGRLHAWIADMAQAADEALRKRGSRQAAAELHDPAVSDRSSSSPEPGAEPSAADPRPGGASASPAAEAEM